MKTIFKISSVLFLGLIMSACGESTTQEVAVTGSDATTGQLVVTENIELIQFHSENRCMTCNKIETNSLETLKAIEGISFRLVNVDENEEEANSFEAAGTALFLHNKETGVKKELTDFAFMNAGDQEKFMNGLREEIIQFGN